MLPLLFLSALATACTTPPVAQARAPSPAPPERSFRAEAAPIALEVRQEAGEEGDAVAPPEPSPPPPHFEGRTAVTYMEFIDALRQIADEQAEDPDVRAAHQALLAEKNLTAEELPLQSFSRARLVFESARDSGLWGIRGTVTDQMPWSDRIWQQWSARTFTVDAPEPDAGGHSYPTAVAECDGLGALFSILARDLGVVAFVDKRDTIGTTGLPTSRVVFPYARKDRKPNAPLSVDLARFLLHQSRTLGGLSTKELTDRRLWHRWENRPVAEESGS